VIRTSGPHPAFLLVAFAVAKGKFRRGKTASKEERRTARQVERRGEKGIEGWLWGF
jgi:hypothetical protein